MGYTFTVTIDQPKTPDCYALVEKGVFRDANGGTWDEPEPGKQLLTINGSGTSGALRYASLGAPGPDQHDYFVATMGLHNYKLWLALATDLLPHDTVVAVLPTYYGGGERSHEWEGHKSTVTAKTKKGKTITLCITKEGKNEYEAQIIVS